MGQVVLKKHRMTKSYNLKTYGQALPNATNDLKAIQITDSSQTNATKAGATISGVTFSSFCIQDIGKPISFVFSPTDELPAGHRKAYAWFCALLGVPDLRAQYVNSDA